MFGAKRKARKIGQDEEDERGDMNMSEGAEDGAGKPSANPKSVAIV